MFTILGAYASEALIFGGKLMGFISACIWILSFIWKREKKYNVRDAVVNSYFYVDRD